MKFSKVYEPRISEYAKDGRLALNSIIGILEDAGSKHSFAAGDDVIESGLRGVSWILVEWNVEIHKLPYNNQKLYVDTWAISKKPELITQREFEIKDQDGNVYINACERLVLEDFNLGKMLKITPEMMAPYNPEEELHHQFDFTKIKEPNEYDCEKPLAVRITDIDFNNHVHNTFYLDYALDVIGEYENQKISGFRILYKKPVMYKDKITAKCKNGDLAYNVGIYKDDILCTLVQIKKN